MTISELKQLKESEDKVEFKEARNQFNYNNGTKSVLGYTVAFANEKGGYLVLGLEDTHPHNVCGSQAFEGREGQLEQDIYRDTGIRVNTEVLYEGSNRVLIIKIPSRPVGKPLYFNEIPLMRVGDGLRRMSEEMYLSIIQEQEPDFSAKVCEGISIADLDESAINKMKESYAHKQNNPGFLLLSSDQVLNDLKLLNNGKLNYAALILLAKTEIIKSKLPQSKIIWEFRNNESQIYHDYRVEIDDPLFIAIDKIWKLINQPSLNKKYPIQSGAYVFDMYDFNEEVIREAILNAIAHRDYTITSEVVIKQYSNKITIINPGGFPKGVTIDNILTVSSTPRSRLMTEILEKTGLVERSGQGVDKIYSITLSEGKVEPDYRNSDLFQVSLTLRSDSIDKAFHIFVRQYQKSDKEPKLGVDQIITLYKLHKAIYQNLNADIISQLEKSALIKKVSGHSNRYTLSQDYYALVANDLKIGNRYIIKEIELILSTLQGNKLKMGKLEEDLKESLNRNQIKYLTKKLSEDGILTINGTGSGTTYSIHERFSFLRGDLLFENVISFLRSKKD